MMENIPWLSEIIEVQEVVFSSILPVFWDFFKTWWWLPLPFLLWPNFKYHWLYWRNRVWEATSKTGGIMLEVRIPGEMLKPIRAMESVLSGFWQIYGEPNWFEKWWKGEYGLSFSLEIASIDGTPHFLLKIPESQRDIFESHIYAQYPEAEINEVEDYVKNVPQDIPNDHWDILGTDYTMVAPDCFPLRTYAEFETEREAKEEKRVDPMSSLLEGLSLLKQGEQVWIQIKLKPVTDAETGFVRGCKKMRDSLVKRKEPPKKKSILMEAWETLIDGIVNQEKSDEKMHPPEMMLTPGEKEAVAAIERKMSKHIFKTHIRFVYISKKESFFGGRFKFPMSFFNQFNNPTLNTIIPWGKTITKVKQNWYDFYFMKKKRLYIKKRRMFRNYVDRKQAFDPVQVKGASFILNTEEVASIFHFPSRISAPASVIQRVESKKKEAPFNLPTEDDE